METKKIENSTKSQNGLINKLTKVYKVNLLLVVILAAILSIIAVIDYNSIIFWIVAMIGVISIAFVFLGLFFIFFRQMYFVFFKEVPMLFSNIFITKDKEGKTGIKRGAETIGDLSKGCFFALIGLVIVGVVIVVIIAIVKWAFGVVF